ncbi:MAG TPA: glycoside hydrolase family 2 TIM barrel-domain containing protein [Lachnospiraceae bacterium]
MRVIECINENWSFRFGDSIDRKEEELVNGRLLNLPYTYNGFDGQDGGANYYKGKTVFSKLLQRPLLPKEYRVYIEFGGVNSVCDVYANGKHLLHHRGGYSRFRVDISKEFLEDDTLLLSVLVDNANYSDVYPQMADFTFYGGIYRDVYMIAAPETSFCLDYFASEGAIVKSKVDGDFAQVDFEAYVDNAKVSDMVAFSIIEEESEEVVAEVYAPASKITKASARIYKPHLWQGVEDPYLYQIQVKLIRHNEVLDELAWGHGIREFYVDPKEGFFLNGIKTPLRGVSRHQDRLGIGNALTIDEHVEDALLMQEMGVNTIRLAHYQQDKEFYELCDRLGFVVWAEIPFISVVSSDEKAHENAMYQMKELIYQNFNHTSICAWGISNEITIGGDKPGLYEKLVELEALVKSLDSTRLTTMAQVSMLPRDSKHNQITDVYSYNIYYGWYGGVFEDNEKFLDDMHKRYPNRPIGISEYGCEGIISWHNDEPKVRDYSEEYQALYHEHMLEIITKRDYLWATHVWNMFDFGCDSRDEGGVKGRNNKGLITLDRKIKKDSFFLYKAYWSEEAFVHITGRRYAYRHNQKVDIKVYSNQPEVTLYVNGECKTKKSGDKIFIFEGIELVKGDNHIFAVAGEGIYDSISLLHVDTKFEGYVMPVEEEEERDGVKNWFEDVDMSKEAPKLSFKEGFYSIKDTIGDILANEDASNIMADAMATFSGMKVKKTAFSMMAGLSLEDMSGAISQDKDVLDKALAFMNAKLQEIKK